MNKWKPLITSSLYALNGVFNSIRIHKDVRNTIEENYFHAKITLKNSNWGQYIKYYPPSTKEVLKTQSRLKIFVKNRLIKLTYLVFSKAATGGAL